MTAYLLKRNGDVVGYVTDETLADEIDGLETTNDAADPAYCEQYRYETEAVPNDDIY